MSKYKFIIITLVLIISNCLIYAQQDVLPAEERESYIQQAIELRKQENYGGAVDQLNKILERNPKDAPILLMKGDLLLQSKEFSDAVEVYKTLLPLEYEQTIVRINLSYALFMNKNASKALEYARSAWVNDSTNANAIVNYFNAMLWNTKTGDASDFLSEHSDSLKQDQVLVMKARLYTSSGDYKNGLSFYDSLASNYENKYYTQEYAEVLIGKKEINKAQDVLVDAKGLYSANEYSALMQKLDNAQMDVVGTEFVYFEDIADNIRTGNSIWWQQAEGGTYRFGLRGTITTNKSISHEKTTTQILGVSVNEKWSMAWHGQTDIILQRVSINDENHFVVLTGKQLVQYKPTDRQMYGLSFSTDILNFTPSLLESNIRIYNLGYVFHTMFDAKNGFYSQGSAGLLSDDNQKYEFFGSFYHLFGTQPLLKTGLNFSGLHYNDDTITTYFSPWQYISSEIFVEYGTNLFGREDLRLDSQGAFGVQKIESQSWDSAYRMQAEIKYIISDLMFSMKYQTSNVKSSTGTGYQFDWLTFQLQWKW